MENAEIETIAHRLCRGSGRFDRVAGAVENGDSGASPRRRRRGTGKDTEKPSRTGRHFETSPKFLIGDAPFIPELRAQQGPGAFVRGSCLKRSRQNQGNRGGE